jgi:RNA polymerase sigma factor (sigma-70 family)
MHFLWRVIACAGINQVSDTPMEDAEYLRRYAAQGSEDAFAALVQRYLPLVYAAALRRVGRDAHRAEDVAQLVFTALARNARALTKHPDLAGWLFVTTRFLATKAVRGELRRQSREQEATMTDGITSDDSPPQSSEALHAILDDVLMELRQLDRQVLLLRFHRGLRLAEIAAQLGATENAVQKRVDRALDRLKDKLARRGITSTAAALALVCEQQAAVAMPAGLAAAATSAGLVGGVGAGSLWAVSTFMTVSKLQFGIVAAIVVGASAGLVWQVRENSTLRAETATQVAAANARTIELRNQLAALTHRADAAEADAASLRRASQSAAVTQSTPARSRALVDANDQAKAALNHAFKLTQEGKFQEALDEYLKCYLDLAGRRGMPSQQIVMNAIERLGRSYAPALIALRELRDTAMQRLQASPGTRELVFEIALLNERLGDGRASMALYDTLPPNDPGRQSIGAIAHKSFVEARRYADALVGKSFGNMLNELDMGIRHSAGQSGQSLANYREFVVSGTLANIEVLAGVGRLDEARVLTDKLLAFDGSEATRAAIKEHVTRATGAASP